MIELVQERLPALNEGKLRLWLSKPEMVILRMVIAGRAATLQAKAVSELLQDNNADSALLMSKASMCDSIKYENCLKVLEEICDPTLTEHFTIPKLTTATKTHEATRTESTEE